MKVELTQLQKEKILASLNENGRLPCAKALRLAKELDIEAKNMCSITDQLGVKIGECELGVFGSRPLGPIDEELYKKILVYSDANKKVTCPELWNEAKSSSMKKVRSTVNQTDLFVTYCGLGCFEEGKKWKRK